MSEFANRAQRRAMQAKARSAKLACDTPAVSVEAFIAQGTQTDSRTLLRYVIGVRGMLSQEDAAMSVTKLGKLFQTAAPTSPIILELAGYDDDPRELHEIPETRAFLGWFAALFHAAGLEEQRLIATSRTLLAIGRHILGVPGELTVDPGLDGVREGLKAIADYQDVTRRGLN